MKILRVANWDKNFESAKSREYTHRSQFYCPNKHGLGYRRILASDSGEAVYGCWQAMCQVLSRQEKPRHGYLTDTGRASGRPWLASDIALVTSYSEATCHKMLEICSSDLVGWIEVTYVTDTTRISEGPKDPSYLPSPLPLPLSTSTIPEQAQGVSSKPEKPKTEPSDDAKRLAVSLATSIRSWKPDFGLIQPGKNEQTVSRWANDIDKMLRLDRRHAAKVLAIIEWLPSHEGADGKFRWRDNILSGVKLREQYDKLDIAMSRNGSKPHKPASNVMTPEQLKLAREADR